MSKKNQFKVDYDYQPNDIVSAISNVLDNFGLTIECIEEDNDGYEIYEVRKIKTDEKEKEE